MPRHLCRGNDSLRASAGHRTGKDRVRSQDLRLARPMDRVQIVEAISDVGRHMKEDHRCSAVGGQFQPQLDGHLRGLGTIDGDENASLDHGSLPDYPS